MRSSTATATTATANPRASVIGRFAPSPTGLLHAGSLLAALGSCLQARAAGGRWLLRIEDLDRPRCPPRFESEMLRTLEQLGFTWDGPLLRQSERSEHYDDALQKLATTTDGQLFRCVCTRRDRRPVAGDVEPQCIANCRDHQAALTDREATWRWQANDARPLQFDDLWQGSQTEGANQHGASQLVLKRRDGLFAYSLAVVVDDAAQGVTQIIRGADLLDQTLPQIRLKRALGLPTPHYGHLPLLLEADGTKLSKSAHSLPLDGLQPERELFAALLALQQQPPAALASESLRAIWQWAEQNWRPERLQGLRTVRHQAA